jgi:hypothetical protein
MPVREESLWRAFLPINIYTYTFVYLCMQRRRVQIIVDDSLWVKARTLALKRDISFSELIESALLEELKR